MLSECLRLPCGVGGAKREMGTQRPVGVTVLVVVAATVMLISAPSGQALSLPSSICPLGRSSVEIYPYDTVYLLTRAFFVRIKMESVGCVNSTQFLLTKDFKDPNKTAPSLSLGTFDWDWHEFTFISCGKYIAKIGHKIVTFQVAAPSHCLSKGTALRVGTNVVLGTKCSGPERKEKQSKAECKKLDQEGNLSRIDSYVNYFKKMSRNTSKPISRPSFADESDSAEPARNTFHNKRIFPTLKFSGNKHDLEESEANSETVFNEPEVDISEDIFKEIEMNNSDSIFKGSDVDDEESFINWPIESDILHLNPVTPTTYNSDDLFSNDRPSYTVHGKYKENAIPIFIGIVALTVSMCLRFCLCRGKSVVRRVTTVTVIRSRSVGSPEAPLDQQDPPPSYVDVVNQDTSPESPIDEECVEPPPPAYADIIAEVQPPTYSEVEAQTMPTSEMLPLAEQEAGAQNTQPPPDSDAKGLATTKSMLSKYRHQQKQFAFKVLEED